MKVGLNKENEVEHVFYKKEMANKTVMHKQSANSIKQKMSSLTQQCFMRIHNCSDNVKVSEKAKILTDFMIELKCSGYNEEDRVKILELKVLLVHI